MTNRELMKNDQVFLKACELAGVQPSVRQASKFRGGSKRPGKASMFRARAIQELKGGEKQ
jgi:hypothetical protein